MIQWTMDDSEIYNTFNNLENASENIPYADIGALLVESVHQNFDAEGRPDAWEPRQDDNPWPILKKTGDLYNSITYELTGDGVNVYSTTDYGDYHDLGTQFLPVRAFLLIQDEDEVEIENLIYEHIFD